LEQYSKTLIETLVRHEGLKLKPYRCTANKLTIGVGRNIEDNGITEDEALYLLNNDIKRCVKELENIFGKKVWYNLSKIRQEVLINMLFNLGKSRFTKFKKMIKAINNEDYTEASIQMEDSRWYKQVGNRAKELVSSMKSNIQEV
jgi:lysozyme